ncbi:MAG TPA: TonB-dependent receptor plug domain-containing protein [Longimicrobiaceae bacterium]|nr:TonB-dependent receptor plug domain-containing protein [Longimicrobiaceae bacterium]
MLCSLRRCCGAGVVVLCLIAAIAADSSAQGGAVGDLRVEARDAGSRAPVAGAQVIVQGMGVGGVTDQSGVLVLSGVAAGVRAVSVAHLGYGAAMAHVSIPVGGLGTGTIELVRAPLRLAPLRVVAEARLSPPEWTGFYQRLTSRPGTFFTRADILRIKPRFLSDLLRQAPGVSLSPTGGGRAHASMRGPSGLHCPVQYFIDGTPADAGYEIDDLLPEDVAGVEIYRGPASLPAQFNRGNAMCGVIVVWTR